MKVIYYMPLMLKKQAELEGNQRALDFCELFKVVSSNACLIDRTDVPETHRGGIDAVPGVLKTPFDFEVIFPLSPSQPLFPVTFEQACIGRALYLLRTGQRIVLMYSGGLDSVTALTALFEALGNKGVGHVDQIVIAATPYSIIENPWAWEQMVLPNFKVISMNSCLAEMQLQSDTLYVMGENADQLFGSDIILANMWLFEQEATLDNIRAFAKSRQVSERALDYVVTALAQLCLTRPGLKTMADLIWWLNFTCKWQSVALRALCFSRFLDSTKHVSELERFRTFFNTPEFQDLAASDQLERWGSPPSPTNYKLASRKFITRHSPFKGAKDWAASKLKMPSLYRVLSAETHQYTALGIDDAGNLHPVTDIPLYS